MRKFHVCMLCDRLDLGGVETHIVTLANRLARLGHRVTVISGGGRLACSLVGVRHITLPVYRKRAFFYLFFFLWRFFKRERFDIVHAHTRFSAFLCRPLVKRRLVTTAHWVFDTAFPKKQLTAWGDKTLAVSADIADYLKKEYRKKDKDICVTVNGIDTEGFYPQKTEGEKKRVVYCSRMDRDRAAVAFLLLRVLRSLPEDALSLTVLGDGDCFEALKEETRMLLKERPTLDIRLVGGVTEVAPYLRNADILVGVSRAALEGMAAGCAVLLAGNEGYLSVFSPRDAAEAEKSNFCCRDTQNATEALLHRDLLHLLRLPKEALHRMGKENRRYIEAHYSVSRMASDTLSVYESICKERCVLCGYYGFQNIGDTLLACALTQKLKKEGYGDVLLLSSKYLSLRAWLALKAGYDLHLGGGTLLQDETSRRSLAFYLYFAQRARRVKVHGGIGTLTREGEARVACLLMSAEGIDCRTRGDLARAVRLDAKDARLSFDTALALPFPKRKKGEDIILALKAPRREEEAAVCAFALRLARTLGRERLILFPMHKSDRPFLKRIAALAGIRYASGGAEAFLTRLSHASLVIASRLHAGICALGVGVPFLLYEGEEKCRFLIEDIKASVEDGAFCGLFSFNDRILAPPPADGIEKAKRKMLERI